MSKTQLPSGKDEMPLPDGYANALRRQSFGSRRVGDGGIYLRPTLERNACGIL